MCIYVLVSINNQKDARNEQISDKHLLNARNLLCSTAIAHQIIHFAWTSDFYVTRVHNIQVSHMMNVEVITRFFPVNHKSIKTITK